jgi:hypothetical protein
MIKKLRINALFAIVLVVFIAACQKNEDVLPVTQASAETPTQPVNPLSNNNQPSDNGTPSTTPLPAYQSTISFSGMTWNVRKNDVLQGPGPNIFSQSSQNVWVDGSGYLHLKIRKDGDKWTCAEIESANKFGYGTYIFKVRSNVADINKNVVAGFFSWDNTSFQSQANSEVDIEFAKWGNSGAYTYTSSVQPVKFDNPDVYLERTSQPAMDVSKLRSASTHAFTWSPTNITWKSYEGSSYPGSNMIATWQYNNANQPRIKYESGNQSAPVVIPAPGNDTRVHINLWLFNGMAPSDGNEVELVVEGFQYIPLPGV